MNEGHANIEPAPSAWRLKRRGRTLDFSRPPRHDLHEITYAILYGDPTGCQWAYLPDDFPPHQSVHGYVARWQKGGVFAGPSACSGSWYAVRKAAQLPRPPA